MKVIEWNQELCAGCGTCEAICSFVHEQECAPTLSRIKILKDRQFGNNKAYLCLHCTEAYCLETCPRHAPYRDEKTGTVQINTELCRGCGACVVICPVGGVHMANREKPPCEAACPLGMDIQAYNGLVKEGKIDEAYKLVRKTNPLPAICGRVCRNPCETACKRNHVDSPVAIRSLKRFITDNAGKEPEIPEIVKNGLKVAVVGSGPAGLTAAYDLALMGYRVTVFEALPEPGGVLRVGIPEYRLPKDILSKDISYISKIGVEIRTGVQVGKDITLEELKKSYQAVFMATGAANSMTLGVKGEDMPGVIYGIDFLKAVNMKQSVEVGKNVLVIGGGNVAIDCARTARRLGAGKVDLACLEGYDVMPADKREIKQAENEGITLHPGQAVSRILGESKVSGVEFLDVRSIKFDEQGMHLVTKPGTEKVIPAQTVIVAIGQSSELPGKLRAEMQRVPSGAITIAFGDGIFVAGDAIKQTTVVEAMAAGRQVARSIDCLIKGIPVLNSVDPVTEKTKPMAVADISKLRQEWEPLARIEPKNLSTLLSIRNFLEVEKGYTAEQAREEASRCNCRAGTVIKCDQCGGDPECVKWCGNEALTIKEADSVSSDRKVAYHAETIKRLS